MSAISRRAFLWTSVIGLAVTPTAWAQTSGKCIAVVVGVSNYKFGYSLLDGAGRDARRVGQALDKLGYSVTVRAVDSDSGDLVERHDVIKALQRAVAACEPEDTLLFYFSGHGSLRNGKTYLLLSDTDPDNFQATTFVLEGKGKETLGGLLADCRARRRILIMDACRSTSSKGGQSGFAGGKLRT